MPWSRRSFVKAVGWGGAALAAPLVSARGREAAAASLWSDDLLRAPNGLLRLDSNENPYGPAAEAVDAIREAFEVTCRYPMSAEAALVDGIAGRHGVPREQILMGCGSNEILKVITETSVSPTRALVT